MANQKNSLKTFKKQKTAANSGFAKFGLDGLMGRSFCIFGFSPNGMVRGNINPNFAKPRDVSCNIRQNVVHMKIIENKPLTEFSKLPIQVYSTNKVDLTKSELDPNEQEELIKKLFQEIVKLKDSGIILAQSSGSESYVMAKIIPSKAKNNPLIFTEPNPVTIYYNCAIAHIEISLNLQAKIINNSWNPVELYDEFISFFSESFQGITQLLMSLEALFNQLIPDGVEINLNGKSLTKKDIEWQKFKEKYRYILPEISGINLFQDYNADYLNIITLNDIRNDLIHLKSIRQENFTYYQTLFKTLIDLDYKRYANSVYNIITILQ